jgi:2-methylcitrate dehydratase PrpD
MRISEKLLASGCNPSNASTDFSLTEQLVKLNRRPVDVRTRQRAVLHWLDWIGCVAAGSRAPVARSLANWRPLTGGDGSLVSAQWPALAGTAGSDMQAVWLDAGLANIEEMDDMHRDAILHPGPVVLPVVAHFARHANLTIDQTLDAVVRGYETMIRVGRSLGPGHYALWHNTATAGVFGAAAAAADALQLSDEQATWALGNAGTQAAGLWQVRLEPVMSKQLHTGHAAWAGLTAALLARADFTGPRFILEGERGFFAALCPDAMPQRVLEPAADWLIHSTSFKPWPSCRHTHAAIDCVLAIRKFMGNIPLNFIEARVEGSADAVTMCNTPVPQTRTQAKFSLQYCVAAAARWGRLLPGHFDEPHFAAPEMRATAARSSLHVDPDLDKAYPAHFGARVTMTLADGSVHTASVVDSMGDPELPMSSDELLEKARELMRYGGVTSRRSDAVLDGARALLEITGQSGNTPFPHSLLNPLF